MYARITPYQLRPGSFQDAADMTLKLKDQIMALPGLVSFTCTVDDAGKGYIVSLVTDKATAEANGPKVAEIWGQMAPYLAARPEVEGHDVVAYWPA